MPNCEFCGKQCGHKEYKSHVVKYRYDKLQSELQNYTIDGSSINVIDKYKSANDIICKICNEILSLKKIFAFTIFIINGINMNVKLNVKHVIKGSQDIQNLSHIK